MYLGTYLSTLLLKYPTCDVNKLFRNVEVKVFGIDLHWMVHVQGSLEIAKILKALHPHVPVLFGGISSTCSGRKAGFRSRVIKRKSVFDRIT
jgi:clorobiocin biosynthesis protein CloN6